jgi:hypothetical protein
MVQNVFSEIHRLQSLALQTPLHVGKGHHNGVDITLVDAPAKIVDAEMTGVAQIGHAVSLTPSSSTRSQHLWQLVSRR